MKGADEKEQVRIDLPTMPDPSHLGPARSNEAAQTMPEVSQPVLEQTKKKRPWIYNNPRPAPLTPEQVDAMVGPGFVYMALSNTGDIVKAGRTSGPELRISSIGSHARKYFPRVEYLCG